MVVQAFVDRTGFLLLLTSLAAVLLLPLEIWGALSARIVFAAIVGIALFVAGRLLLRRWPGVADAAALADRQLELDDLLTTICDLRPVLFDDLSAAVKTIADQRCSELRTSDVRIPRMTARAWSGIALTTGIAIALAVVPFRESKSQHVEPNASMVGVDVDPLTASESAHSQAIASRSGRDPVGSDESQITASIDSDDNNHKGLNHAADSRRANNEEPSGAGGGSSISDKHGSVKSMGVAATAGSTSYSSGIVSGGGNESVGNGTGTDSVSETAIGQSSAQKIIPSWQSSDWPAARAAAISSVNNGAIPAGCRDLVRDYFR